MSDIESIKNRLQHDGYAVIHEYNDAPGEEFPGHTHDGDELLFVITGNLFVQMDGRDYNLTPGDELFFPAKKLHSAKVGPNGCFYIVGEKT